MLRCIIFVFLLNFCSSLVAVSVKSKLGVINGESEEINFGGKRYNVNRYLGIPYAQPPVGKLRFQRPKPVAPFDGPFDALKDGPICPQSETPGFPPTSTYGMSEDCLHLSVFQPVQEPDQPSGHAVLFFIHGGGFTLGTGRWTRGDILASVGNVIVVTINYRIGLFGFLDMDDERAAGSLGFWDQHQALVWVNENIEAFRGDKNRVVIFGESAGGTSVTVQMLYPGNKGLFHGAIAESGTVHIPSIFPKNTIAAGTAYAEALNCSTENTDEIIDCLQACKYETIFDLTKDAMESGDFAAMMKFAILPSVDGVFVKSNPFDLFDAAKTENVKEVDFARSIKFINGVNGNEGAFFIIMQNRDTMDDVTVSRESINAQIPAMLPMVVFEQNPTAPTEAVTKLLLSEYTDWSDPDDPVKLREQLARFYGDVYFNVPAIAFSRIHANASSSDSYMYYYRAFTEYCPMPRPKWLTEATHGDELSPVFGYDAHREFKNSTKYYTPETWEVDLATRMITYWSNFAKSGDPNNPISSTQSSWTWPEYELDSQEHIIFDRKDALGSFLYARETDFWNNIIPAVMKAVDHPETVSTSAGKEEACQKDGDCGGE